VTNDEVAVRIDSSDEWIQQRTGIETRRFADETETVLDMATWAAQDALKKAKLSITDIDTIIVATITFPFQAPSAATAILQRLGHPKAAAFDINAACAGFSYGVSMAHDFIKSGTSKTVLVIGAEKISDFTDPDDRATAFIFADGAGAVVIGASQEAGIGPVEWGSDADERDAIQMNPSWIEVRDVETQLTKAGSKWPNISQEGQKVFRWAVFSMSKAALKALESAGLSVNDLDAFIPHQANVRIIETMAKEMKMPDSVIIADDIRKNGNTSAASIPLAMDALLQKHPELHGKLALLIGYGAGLVYAGQVVKLPPKP
jgi:3-oxoacyl-(acyl-carrier-protein) synthase III